MVCCAEFANGVTLSVERGLANSCDAQFKAETDALEKSIDSQTESLETILLKPSKANIAVKLLSLAWAPYWHDAQGQASPAWE